MGKMDKKLTSLVLDGPNSLDDDTSSAETVDVDELAGLLGISKEKLLETVNRSSNEVDPYED